MILLSVFCVARAVVTHGQQPALSVAIATNGSTQIHGSVRSFGTLFPPSPPGFVREKTVIWNVAKRPYMGVQIRDLSDQLAKFFHVEGGGVLVEAVEPDGPADKAGVKAGDIITGLDETRIAGTGMLSEALDARSEGDVIKLDLVRREKSWKVELTLAKGTMQSSTVTFSGDDKEETANQGVTYGQQHVEIDIQKLLGSMGRLMPPPMPGRASAQEQEALRRELDELKREMQELRKALQFVRDGVANTNRMDEEVRNE